MVIVNLNLREDVKTEMVVTKGLDPDAAEKIGSYVRRSGRPVELLSELMQDEVLMANKSAGYE